LFNEEKEYFSFSYRFTRNLWFKWSAKRADYVFTVSNYSRESIHRFYHIPLNKIGITPNGVDSKFFDEYDKNSAKKLIEDKIKVSNYILYVSRIEPRKNQAMLIRAYLKLGLFKKGYRLVLIGKNSLNYPEFEQLIAKQGKENGIIYIEQVNDKTLIDLYKGATAFVYPSKAEGFGIPPIEAGALKIPVLCSNATALSDFSFFEPFMFDPNDEERFAVILEQFLSQLQTIDTASIRVKIQNKYSWEHTVTHFSASILK
jgi:glycosyltransferase involved in cell wall biosynthesis